MGWHRDSSAGAVIWDTQPLTPDELRGRDEEIDWLLRHERRGWSLVNGRIAKAGDPVAMAEGTYGALGAYPPAATLASLTLSATEQAALAAANIATYTPMPANSFLTPQAWGYRVAGVYTTVATPGSVVFTMRLGNANTSPSLGASALIALTASLTNAFWMVDGSITVRSAGAPGTNFKANGVHWAKVNTAVGGAYNAALWGTGTTDASFDGTIALGTNGGGMWIGANDSGATNHGSLSIQHIHWFNWN